MQNQICNNKKIGTFTVCTGSCTKVVHCLTEKIGKPDTWYYLSDCRYNSNQNAYFKKIKL